MSYPVVSEHALSPVARRLLARTARSLDDLPEQTPGTVLVFEVNGRHVAFRDRHHLTGREETVVNAVSVSLVDVRGREISVGLRLASRRASDDFEVRVRFRCVVTAPELVAAMGVCDLTSFLRGHLHQDNELRFLCVDRDVTEINEVRRDVHARIAAFCHVREPSLNGLTVEFVAVDVRTPESVRDHSTRVRDDEWDRERRSSAHDAEIAESEKLADKVRGDPEFIVARGLVKGEMHSETALRDARETESAHQQRLFAVLEKLPKSTLEAMTTDQASIVDNVVNELLGTSRRPTNAAEPPGRSRRELERSNRWDEDDLDV